MSRQGAADAQANRDTPPDLADCDPGRAIKFAWLSLEVTSLGSAAGSARSLALAWRLGRALR